MSVSQTSIISYYKLNEDKTSNTQRNIILSVMNENNTYSMRELSDLTNIEINAVCGRVNELIKDNIIFHVKYRLSNITNRKVKVYRKLTENNIKVIQIELMRLYDNDIKILPVGGIR